MPIDMVEEFKQGHRHTFTLEDEILGERECTIQVDDPGFDCTDFAHPAWWRGQEHTAAIYEKRLKKMLDAMPPPDRLELLAEHFDLEHALGQWPSASTEVQDDLRKWAKSIRDNRRE